MSEPADWSLAFARQAQADFRAWELLERHPEAVASDCHKLLFLQMACEKLCKSHLIRAGAAPGEIQKSHGYTAKHLPTIVMQQVIVTGQDLKRMHGVLVDSRHLAREIEVLNPAVQRGGRRPDNCEYPWELAGSVISPLDWTFYPSRLVAVRGGPTFTKLLKGSIERSVRELEY